MTNEHSLVPLNTDLVAELWSKTYNREGNRTGRISFRIITKTSSFKTRFKRLLVKKILLRCVID